MQPETCGDEVSIPKGELEKREVKINILIIKEIATQN